ncbi:p21-C-terminal region-binding protein-domain-containing protein [Pavlovales sp. CCMP2436]|nr:p21-C-terminal region-binding protein-domain-containing protein [Pavlovales sp. CCMP2436]
MDDELVEIDFEFHDPIPDDFHSTRALLQSSDLLDAAAIDISELAELLTEQAAVGTVLKSGGPEEPALALLSCIPLRPHAKRRSIQQLQGALLAQCPPAMRAELEAALVGSSANPGKGKSANKPNPLVGLFVNERLVNVPSQLLPDLHRSLAEDLAWAVENADPPSERAQYKLDTYIALVRCERADTDDAHKGPKGGGRGDGGKRPRAEPKQPPGPAGAEGFVALRPDDELLRQAATLAFPVASRLPARGRGAPSKLLALLLTADAVRALPARLKALAKQ